MAGPLALGGPTPMGPSGIAWAATATLDRPVFDRKTSTVNVPFKGSVPNHTIQYLNGATRLNVVFLGASPKVATAYKLAVYHELLSQVELIPEDGGVRLSILTAKAAKLKVDVDRRHGQLRLVLEEVGLMDGELLVAGTAPASAAPPTAAPFTVQNGPPPNGLAVLTPSPPALAPPMPPASMPPIRPPAAGGPGYAEPGSPASGQYVYRKAVPTGNQDVTEVQVRTGTKAEVDIQHDPRAQNVVVNVVRPDAPASNWSDPQAAWAPADVPAPAGSWRLPTGLRRDVVFRPMPAVDAVVGYALVLNESAPTLGSDFTGQGATTWGFDAHVPLGNTVNLSLGVDSLAYTITSPQVKDSTGNDAQTRRDEFFGRAQLEYLAVRSPWVFAVGAGYWGRYMMNKSGTLLAPTSPSLVIGPNQLFHGPALQTRLYVPVWASLGVAGELGAAPYMLGGQDAVATSMGPLFGYQGGLGLKWGTRNLSVTAGYRHFGFGNFGGSYSYGRGGPEASVVWRF